MDLEYTVDPKRSAVTLASHTPVGWTFFELNRDMTRAVVTFIRPKIQELERGQDGNAAHC